MNYIAEMRKTVGQGLIMTVGCGVLIENDKDQVLLQKRSDTGEWCVPGGAMGTPRRVYRLMSGNLIQ